MDNSDSGSSGIRRFAHRLRHLVALLAITAAVIAIVTELRRPKDQRTWHGKVAGIVPYDFRVPTMDRIKERTANPDGPVLTPQVVGVGWTVNVGGVLSRLKGAMSSPTSQS